MHIMHVVKNPDDIGENLQKLSDIQVNSLKYNVSILAPKRGVLKSTIKKMFGRPFDAIHVHTKTDKFNKLSKVVVNQNISDYFLKKDFHSDIAFQLLLNKEILFYFTDARLVVFNSIGKNLKMEIVKALGCGIPVIVFSDEAYLNVDGLMFIELLGPKALAKKIRDIIEGDVSVDCESIYSMYSIESLALSLDKKYKGLNNS